MMDAPGGYFVPDVPCPACNQLHDLFIELGSPTPATYRFTCPHTQNAATWLCDRAVQLSKEKPESAIHAVRHED